MKKLIISLGIFVFALSSYAAEKSFSCGHGGAGNEDISGTVVFSENHPTLKDLEFSWGSPRHSEPFPIYVSEWNVSSREISFSGVIFQDLEPLEIALEVEGDFSEEDISGAMTVGSRQIGIYSGNCSFSGF